MLEMVTTRANPMVDPTVAVWGWEIPVYLFLGGWVAGIMVLAGFFVFLGRHGNRRCVCFKLPLVGLALISAGMAALFLDLEHKLYVWRLYVTLEPLSPMSWGAWILLLVYPVLVATTLLRLPERAAGWPLGGLLTRASAWLGGSPARLKALGLLSMVTGVLLGVYTGILLSSLGARPLWSSALLGPLFLVSGLSAGAAFAHMVAREREESVALAKADNAFLGAELVLIALFFIGLATAGEAHQQAAALFFGGPYTAVFWAFVVVAGILAPLLIQSLAVNHRIPHTPMAPLLVLAGGLVLRWVIGVAGQHSHWLRV